MSISINLTIHNKAFLIREVLSRIVNFTVGAYELVCVIDGCTDNSLEIVDKFCLEKHVQPRILFADNVFETKANNLAARNSDGDYIIIVQDDCLIDELGWNERLLKPFSAFNDVFAVTGRTAHNWIVNPYSQDINNDIIHSHRWCDVLRAIDEADRTNSDRDSFVIRDTVNRSPMAINHADLQTMDYFDEAFSPQDSDDHDLMYRMHAKLGKVCGMVPMNWWSREEWGGTRVGGGPARWLLEAHHKNQRLLYRRHRDAILARRRESRKI